MGKPRIATPMLEAFLRKAKQPPGGVWPAWQDWPLAGLALLLCIAIPVPFLDWVAGLVAGGFVLQFRRQIRARQIQVLNAKQRADRERWDRIARLVYLAANGMLHNHVPGPVLTALEMTARRWHEVREEVQEFSAVDPVETSAAQTEIDAIMELAASAAFPVILTDYQGRTRLREMEEDDHLMATILRRIEAQQLHLVRWTDDTQSTGGSSGSLRERLERAKTERAAAEAELNNAISPKSSS